MDQMSNEAKDDVDSTTTSETQAASATADSNRIVLNVGGKRFETTKTTLLSIPNSLFSTMFSERNESIAKPSRDNAVEFFFDSNAKTFCYILELYRRKATTVPYWHWEAFAADADYWGIQVKETTSAAAVETGLSWTKTFKVKKKRESFLSRAYDDVEVKSEMSPPTATPAAAAATTSTASNVVKLLPALVQYEKIEKAKYNTLPAYIQPVAQNFAHIYKVTITPQRVPGATQCRVNIVTPANFRTGPMQLDNIGRLPKEAPAANLDDLRPIAFYCFGVGTQRFQVTLQSDHNNYSEGSFRCE